MSELLVIKANEVRDFIWVLLTQINFKLFNYLFRQAGFILLT